MNDVDVRGEMMRDDYQEMMQPLLDRLKTVCKEAISSAKISDVTKIKAVGGSEKASRHSQVFATVFLFFSEWPFACNLISSGCLSFLTLLDLCLCNEGGNCWWRMSNPCS